MSDASRPPNFQRRRRLVEAPVGWQGTSVRHEDERNDPPVIRARSSEAAGILAIDLERRGRFDTRSTPRRGPWSPAAGSGQAAVAQRPVITG